MRKYRALRVSIWTLNVCSTMAILGGFGILCYILLGSRYVRNRSYGAGYQVQVRRLLQPNDNLSVALPSPCGVELCR